MKVFIDRDRCEATAYCRAVSGDVFAVGDDDVAHIRVPQDDPLLAERAEELVEAQNLCPTGAISVVE